MSQPSRWVQADPFPMQTETKFSSQHGPHGLHVNEFDQHGSRWPSPKQIYFMDGYSWPITDHGVIHEEKQTTLMTWYGPFLSSQNESKFGTWHETHSQRWDHSLMTTTDHSRQLKCAKVWHLNWTKRMDPSGSSFLQNKIFYSKQIFWKQTKVLTLSLI